MSKSTQNLKLLLETATELSKNPGLVTLLKSVDVSWQEILCDDGNGELTTLVLPNIKVEFKV